MDDTLVVPKTKRKFRGIKAESYLKDKFLHGKPASRSRVLGCTACRGESCTRFLKLMRFFLVCSASLMQLVAPWMLCTLEVVAVLCIYCLGTSRSLVLHPLTHSHHYHFSYRHSLEDIVGISIARTILLSVTYAVGMRYMHRPYLYTSYLLAALCFPAIVVKTILFRYSQDGVSAACLFGLAGLFCWLHVFAARRSVEWVRRRAQLGLTGYGCPWDEAPEDGWTALRRAPDIEEMTKSSDGPEWGEDVAPETLADTDSKFVDVGGVRVHYKEALPPTTHHQGVSGGNTGSIGGSCAERGSSGIVLIHGFGGGVVSWRHVLEPLARHTGLRVVAYDRPAFGLTSRPVPAGDQGNPYTMESQAALVLDLCCQLGLQEVILAGHADGCLLAMKANSLLASERAAGSLSSSSSTAAFTTRPSDSPTPIFRPPSPTLSRDTTHAAAAAAAAAAWPPTGSPSASPTPPSTASHAATGAGGIAGVPAAAAAPATERGPVALSGRRGRRQSAGRQTSSSDHSRTGSSEGEQLYDAASQFGSMGSSSSLCPPFMSTCSSCSLGVQSAYHTPINTSTATPTPNHYPSNPSANCTSSLSPPGFASSTATAHPSGLILAPEGTHTAVCASAAADSCENAGAGGSVAGSGGSSGGAVMFRVNSARYRKPQVAAGGGGGQTPPQSPSLHAWSPNERPCRPLRVIGLALLHPDLSGSLGPSMTRLLARSKLGRSILRPLLRSEIGEVANPRAWYNPEKLTPEVVELYKAPVEGWCEALIETTRLRSSSQKSDLSTCVSDARLLPVFILTGLHDVIVPPTRADQLAQSLPLSRVAVLAECGHLSHEEVPMALLQQLVMFCSQVCL